MSGIQSSSVDMECKAARSEACSRPILGRFRASEPNIKSWSARLRTRLRFRSECGARCSRGKRIESRSTKRSKTSGVFRLRTSPARTVTTNTRWPRTRWRVSRRWLPKRVSRLRVQTKARAARLVYTRSSHGADGRRSEDFGVESVQPELGRQEFVCNRWRVLCVNRLPEPYSNNDGDYRESLRLHCGRVSKRKRLNAKRLSFSVQRSTFRVRSLAFSVSTLSAKSASSSKSA